MYLMQQQQQSTDEMRVIKRNGNIETVSFDKILRRIKTIGKEANVVLNYTQLAMKVIDQLYDKISTTKIDELTADQCASMSSIHYDYGTLAARITISNHHKNTDQNFKNVVTQLYQYTDKNGKHSPLIDESLYLLVKKNWQEINKVLDYNRDYAFDYFGFKTLEKAYLMRVNGKVVERPQHMWMRVSLGIHGADLSSAFNTYNLMSQKYFTHATPTLFNSGTPRPQMSSCFLISMENDSIDGIYSTLKDCALISKWAGGIGLHIHNIRASGSHIRGTNGNSNGIVPMLRVFNNTAKYVDQCLDPDTIVYCKTGPKLIKDVMLGDEVINDDGQFRPVGKVLDYPDYKGPLYTIKVGNSTIKATDMHPFWTENGEWIDAKDLQVGTKIGFPVPKYNKEGINKLMKLCDKEQEYLKLCMSSNQVEYYPVTEISFDPEYTGRVIDIEVLTNDHEHHNFLTNCGLVHNGGGRRHGSFAIYLEPWHADIEVYLQMRKNHGDEEMKARDLFYALWIPDLFMERVKADSTWTLMCPDECPGLADVYGDAFVALYTKYETEGKGRKTVKARDLWFKVLDAQMETGTPYLCYKDAANKKSNQQNVGTIKSSNLCVAPETMILTDKGEQRIDTLVGKKVNVWNGEEWSEVEVFKTGVNKPLMRVITDNGKGISTHPLDGNMLYCTESHKFYLEDGTRIDASDLKIMDKLLSYNGVVQTVIAIHGVCRHDDTYCFTEPKRGMGVFNGILTGQCSEIIEYSDDKETAVCNLASIGLPTFVDKDAKTFDYVKLAEISKTVAKNLNKVIDVNFYPTEKTKVSNLRHRPIGIGVQGLADVFMLMDLPFSSDEARVVNQTIFEAIYFGALSASNELAQKEGPYETFAGSPASEGRLQYHMWGKTEADLLTRAMFDWDTLKANIIQYGLRNSLLLAPMPTASTSQILGFNECFEPFTSNIYSRRTLAGEFILTNKYLMRDLIEAGLWSKDLKNNIIANNGSVQHIEGLPQHLKDKYKTVWEIPMRTIIDMAADRGAFICQSQSLNLWMEDPNYSALTSMHFYAWSKGLKTGIYYLRRRAKHRAQQFTIEPVKDEGCAMCSA